jgi:uncharacterized protein (TIGR03435 family)
MIRILAIVLALVGQNADAPLTFEVASVKPSQGGRAGSTSGPGQYAVTGFPLRAFIVNAYNLKGYEYSGPAWMETEKYDIFAKVPPGTTKEQRAVMLQNLLVERFKIRLHHEQREGTVYDLVVAKGGPKLRPADADEKADPVAQPKWTFTPERFPVIPPGSRPWTVRTGLGGQMSLVTNKYSMLQLADSLSGELERPVYDKTGLTGDFAFLLHYLPIRAATGIPAMQAAGIAAPAPAAPARGGSAASASDAPGAADLDINVAPTLFSALQSQLGLKLEQRKALVDVVVIDSAEKVPIEN